MSRSVHAVSTALLSGVVAAVLSFSAHATPFSSLFVFGDSLSDAGNVSTLIDAGGLLPAVPSGTREATPFPAGHSLVPSLPYSSGRFSNGPVWVEQLATSLGLSAAPSLLGGTNLAWGGARTGPSGAPPTPPLLDQVAGFLASTGGVAPSDALYSVWGGANDVRDAIVLGATDPTGAAALATAAATNIATMVGDLTAAGAVHVIVPNLPDLGLTPALTRLGPVAAGGATALAGLFNGVLAGALAPFVADPTLDIVPFDVFGLLSSVVASPTAFGLANASDPCVDIGSVCGSPGDYLFWDGIHPTTAAHGILASAALRAVVPEPATLLLVAFGVAFAGRCRRRC